MPDLAGNPLSLSRQRQRKAKPRIARFLDDELWREIKTTIETMPRKTDREREHFHRVRWLFSLLYNCGLRISEVIENSMGDFSAAEIPKAMGGGGSKLRGKATRPLGSSNGRIDRGTGPLSS